MPAMLRLALVRAALEESQCAPHISSISHDFPGNLARRVHPTLL